MQVEPVLARQQDVQPAVVVIVAPRHGTIPNPRQPRAHFGKERQDVRCSTPSDVARPPRPTDRGHAGRGFAPGANRRLPSTTYVPRVRPTPRLGTGASVSHSAFDRISPAFPQRAAWGTRRRCAPGRPRPCDRYLAASPRDFLAVATPGRRQDDVRAARRRRAAGTPASCGGSSSSRRPSTSRCSGRTPPRRSASSSTRVLRQRRAAGARATSTASPSPTPGSPRPVAALPGADDEPPTLVILDEVHHAGDALSWGEALREAFEHATRRLSLTGTPFRSDDNPIPFVTYERDAERRAASARADYTYGYAEALRDGVVRPVLFMAYGGAMRWRTKAGDELDGAPRRADDAKDVTAQAWRTALDPKGEWIAAVLRRRRPPAHRGAPPRPGRRRPGHRLQPDARRGRTPAILDVG